MCTGQNTTGSGSSASSAVAPWLDPAYAWGFNTNKDLNALGDEGLTVRQSQSLARSMGYTGEFGGGGFNSWVNADPSRMSSWQGLVSRYAGQDINPYQSGIQARGEWQRGQRGSGYSGDFSDIDPLYRAPQSAPSMAAPTYQDIPWGDILAGFGSGADYTSGRGALNTSIGLNDVLAGLGMGGGGLGIGDAQNPYGLSGIIPFLPPAGFSGQNVEPYAGAMRTGAGMSPLIW